MIARKSSAISIISLAKRLLADAGLKRTSTKSSTDLKPKFRLKVPEFGQVLKRLNCALTLQKRWSLGTVWVPVHEVRLSAAAGEALRLRRPWRRRQIGEGIHHSAPPPAHQIAGGVYSTPSAWSHNSAVRFFQPLPLQGWSCSLSSPLFSTRFQNISTFSSGNGP